MDFAKLAICHMINSCSPCLRSSCMWTNATTFPCRVDRSDIEDPTGILTYNNSCPTDSQQIVREGNADRNNVVEEHTSMYIGLAAAAVFAIILVMLGLVFRRKIRQNLFSAASCIMQENEDLLGIIRMGDMTE